MRASQANWPKYHLDLANTGYNPRETEIGVDNASTLTTAWTYAAGAVHGTPALWRGTLFVAGSTTDDGALVSSLDAATGTVKWSGKIPRTFGPGAGIAFKSGALYLGTNDYVFRSLDARTGAERWSVVLGAIPGDAIPSGGRVYVGTNSGAMYALDAATGAELWNWQGLGGWYGTPALAGGLLYVGGGYDHRLYALDAATGAEVWSYETGASIQSSASTAVSHGVVYVASLDQYLYALDASAGTLVWRRLLGGISSPAIANGVVFVSVYATDRGSMVQALRASDGELLWQTHVSNAGAGSPIVANGVLYITGGLDDTIRALDAATGAPLWSFTAGNLFSDPVLANGMLYAGSEDRILYVFGLA